MGIHRGVNTNIRAALICPEKMTMMTFDDGVHIDVSGPLRTVHITDGRYVVGEGVSIPVADEKEGQDVLREERLEERIR